MHDTECKMQVKPVETLRKGLCGQIPTPIGAMVLAGIKRKSRLINKLLEKV